MSEWEELQAAMNPPRGNLFEALARLRDEPPVDFKWPQISTSEGPRPWLDKLMEVAPEVPSVFLEAFRDSTKSN